MSSMTVSCPEDSFNSILQRLHHILSAFSQCSKSLGVAWVCLCVLQIMSCSEYSTVAYSQYLNQLGVSVLPAAHCLRKHLWAMFLSRVAADATAQSWKVKFLEPSGSSPTLLFGHILPYAPNFPFHSFTWWSCRFPKSFCLATLSCKFCLLSAFSDLVCS